MNEAVQFLFGFCSGAMQETLPQIASRDFVSFLLAQHDAWEDIRKANNAGRLSEEDADFWARWGVLGKRAIATSWLGELDWEHAFTEAEGRSGSAETLRARADSGARGSRSTRRDRCPGVRGRWRRRSAR